uniref:Pco121713 n=1 Tax=Arundo donax TaxID=35708 RepID=A0A0A9DCK5_ARUDO
MLSYFSIIVTTVSKGYNRFIVLFLFYSIPLHHSIAMEPQWPRQKNQTGCIQHVTKARKARQPRAASSSSRFQCP